MLPLQLGAEVNPLRKEGFQYTLDAPTSGMVRRGEDTLTYLNKDQFYPLTLEFVPTPSRPHAHWPDSESDGDEQVTSVVMLQFRERKLPQEALAHWEFWHARQHSPQMRLLDVELQSKCGGDNIKASNGSSNSKIDVDDIAHNAIEVRWCPKNGPATVAVAIHCLSTDFSSQKGVKGIPLHIQVN